MYDPGTGEQVHDFNADIAPSGLFWVARIPDEAIEQRGRSVRVRIENLPVLDSFTFLGPNSVPAEVSFDMTFTSDGEIAHYRPGSDDPTDPTNFSGEFRLAVGTGTFSGSNADGFSFSGTGSTEPLWAELGQERNGSFLP